MKVKEILKLEGKYHFESRLINASPKIGGKIKVSKQEIDLKSFLLGNNSDMILVRVSGESMIDKNINDGDFLIVDTLAQAKENDVVIASLNGELTVKTLIYENSKPMLEAANKKFFPIEIGEFYQFELQGVVRHVIKRI